MYYYSITLKCNVKGLGETSDEIFFVYDEVLRNSEGKNLVSSIERDSKGKNHLHGYFKTSLRLSYKSLKKVNWMVYLRRVYEHTGWYKYLMKDVESHKINSPISVEAQVAAGEYVFI